MAERSKAVVLKTAELSGSVGSNPTPSAKSFRFEPRTTASLGFFSSAEIDPWART